MVEYKPYQTKGALLKKLFLLSIILMGLTLASCAASETTQAPVITYENITTESLLGMMNERRDSFVLINALDFNLASIPTTDHMIPFDQLANHLDLLPTDKNAEIVLYCRSGNKSATAADELIRLGYTNVKNLLGGIQAWHEAGLPLFLDP